MSETRPAGTAPTMEARATAEGAAGDGETRQAAASAPPTAPAPAHAPPLSRLSLRDLLDPRMLQELQDSFSAVTRLETLIVDASGRPLTRPTDAAERARSDAVLEQLIGDPVSAAAGETLSAPIVFEGQDLGSVRMRGTLPGRAQPQDRDHLERLYQELAVPPEKIAPLIRAAEETLAPQRAVAIQSLFVLASHLARLCGQAYQLRERVEELNVLNRLSTLLTRHRDVQQVLDAAARSAAEVMEVKAASIRLLDESGTEMVVKAVHNLSPQYLNKGPILLERSAIARAALAGEVVYVEDMATDPRAVYPEDAEREGVVSVLAAGMVYGGRPIGVFQVYTGERRRFSRFDINLLQSIAQLTATALENARLNAQWLETQRVQRQVRLAADIQRRMIPSQMPVMPPFDIAARYVPSMELSGDFFDFIPLGGHLGVAVGDVVGKGIAASLLMASVRASLRAYAQDVYDLAEIMERVNAALARDTQTHEFATLFYGVLDPQAPRITYCNAGHEPPLLLRKGDITALTAGGMIVGIDGEQRYDKGVLDLRRDDLLVMYTDGLSEALNFDNEGFGRERIASALCAVAGASAQEALNHLLWEMRRFVGLNQPHDDTTLVVIKVV